MANKKKHARFSKHFVSGCCQGEKCFCGKDATHKIEETIFNDDPIQMRHPFTSYICCDCFRKIFGTAVACPVEGQPSVKDRVIDDEGNIGTVTEVWDAHNVIVEFNNGGRGMHCQVPGCELYDPVRIYKE